MEKEMISVEGYLINPYMITHVRKSTLSIDGNLREVILIGLTDGKYLRLDVITFEEITERLSECGFEIFDY